MDCLTNLSHTFQISEAPLYVRTCNYILTCHRYSREEPFTALNVDIRNQQHLFESLDVFVKGDLLEGANAYHCEKCDKKVDTVKRMCIKKLPKILCIQLKRFDYDWERCVLGSVCVRLRVCVSYCCLLAEKWPSSSMITLSFLGSLIWPLTLQPRWPRWKVVTYHLVYLNPVMNHASIPSFFPSPLFSSFHSLPSFCSSSSFTPSPLSHPFAPLLLSLPPLSPLLLLLFFFHSLPSLPSFCSSFPFTLSTSHSLPSFCPSPPLFQE